MDQLKVFIYQICLDTNTQLTYINGSGIKVNCVKFYLIAEIIKIFFSLQLYLNSTVQGLKCSRVTK